jgi:Zn-dependent protease
VTVRGTSHAALYPEGFRRGAVAARSYSLFGIPVSIDVSCGIATALGTWTIADVILPAAAPGRSLLAYCSGGVAAALLVAMSVVTHELAHATAARRAGLGVRGMALSLFGGTTELMDTPRSASAALRVALAGPVASFTLAVIGAAAHVVMVETDVDPLAAAIPAVAAAANLGFALVNLLPALPLDGGHVVTATAWALTGTAGSGVRVVAATGRTLGAALVALSVVGSASGDAGLAIWLALVGMVVWRDAGPAGPVARHASAERAGAATVSGRRPAAAA